MSANYPEVMSELEALGTAQNRKVYARHGIRDEMFGVSYANLGKMVKKLKIGTIAGGREPQGGWDVRVGRPGGLTGGR